MCVCVFVYVCLCMTVGPSKQKEKIERVCWGERQRICDSERLGGYSPADVDRNRTTHRKRR